jgi:predicted permease
VLSFTLALTFGTGILFGLAPALQVSKPELHTVMKQDSPGAGGSRRGGRLQGTLLGVQVAVCMVLVIGAGLLLRGLYATQTVAPGFVYREVAYASYDLESAGYDPEAAAVFQRRLIEQVGALPGVETAAYALREPLSSGRTPVTIRLPGQDENDWQPAELNAVTPGYFSLVGIPIARGRTFTDAELASEAPVAIVTDTTARNYWPGRDPIGQTLLWSFGPDQAVRLQVVGVAGDAQVTSLGRIEPYYVYVPAAPRWGDLELLLRSRADFASTASAVRAAVRTLDPGVAVRVSPLEANLEYWQNLSGSVTALAASLGALALVLASVGIYGVVSYSVSRRVREIGIRMALGAGARNVLGLILRQTMRPVVVGGAAFFVLGVALAAGVLAGRRATEADPVATLRYE